MFPKKLPPFGHGPRVFWAECPKASGTFRGPRSTVFRAAPPYSHLRERHCLYFSQKLPPFLLRRGCGGQVGLVIHSACAADDTFRGPRSLKRSCPTLRVVLVSKDHARHCVSCSSQKTMPDTACRARLKKPCPTLCVVLVSKDHARHCVSCSSPVFRAAPPYSHLRERNC